MRLACILLFGFALMGSVTAAAQTDTTTLTPAQQKAQAAKAARQAAAQQAAQNRAAAAQARSAAAQNKAAQNKPGGNATASNAVGASIPNAANTGANAARTGNTPGSSGNLGTAPKTGSAGTVGSGTLSWQTRVYSSTGCAHNGNSAVCTFTFSNQGNEATLVAGGEMQGIQLVDDAHVPHKADAAHFLDKYGTQQPRLLVQPGDTGTYVLTFSNVNSQVTSADFHLRQQVIGGVTFNSTASAASSAPPKTQTSSGAAGTAPK